MPEHALPFGFPLEFFHDIEQFETRLQRFDLHRGAPVMRLDHFNLHSPHVEETFAFWLELGFRCTEYISTDGYDERITGAWLTRKPTVHDVALTAGRGPRLHHLGFYVAEPSGVLRACDQLAAAGYASSIERGPGRHGVSNAFFVYLRDPDGHRAPPPGRRCGGGWPPPAGVCGGAPGRLTAGTTSPRSSWDRTGGWRRRRTRTSTSARRAPR